MRHRFRSTILVLFVVVMSSYAGVVFGGLDTAVPNTTARAVVLQGKTQGYHNVLVVSPAGGDYTSIQEALYSINDNTDSNRYLIWVGPGIYTEQVTTKPYVDIEGAGENLTKITFSGSSTSDSGTVIGASNSELRSLTVENSGGNAYAYAIGIYNLRIVHPDSYSLLHVAVSASGATNNVGVFNNEASTKITDVTVHTSGGSSSIGVLHAGGDNTMTNVRVTASGGSGTNIGVRSSVGEITMTNVSISASGGSSSDAGSGVEVWGDAHVGSSVAKIYDSDIKGDAYGLTNSLSYSEIHNSRISGSVGISNHASYRPVLGLVIIDNATITGSTNTIVNANHGGTVLVGASELSGGPVVANGGTIRCANVYDETYAAYTSTCP